METCRICQKSFKILGNHLKKHKIKKELYYRDYTNDKNICKICGKKTKYSHFYLKFPDTCSKKCAAAGSWNEDRKKRHSEIISKKWQNNENDYRNKQIKRRREFWNSEEGRKIKSKAASKCWSREEYRNNLKISLENAFSNFSINKKEQLLFDILNELFPNCFEYVGDWSLFIKNKNPDFIDKTNKIIVEMYGNYWHRNDTKKQIKNRISLFKSEGYKTLIIWEKELDNKETCKEKIKAFIGEIA